MGKFKFLFLVALCLACASADQQQNQPTPNIVLPNVSRAVHPAELVKAGIHWRAMEAPAFLKAKRERRPIMMYLHDETCEPCTVMERATLNDPEVVARLNSEFMPILVSDEMKKEVEESMGQLILPAIVFLNPDGEHLLTIQGFVPPSKFKFVLEVILSESLKHYEPTETVLL